VRIEASALMSYLKAYVEGKLPMYNPPKGAFTPGANGVGVVHAVGRNLWHLKPGQAAWNALWFSLNTEKPGICAQVAYFTY
jgi:D-arabinose 1-dehydrogenase-like Zn-dependent alcohol dehydrogenase